MSDFSDKATSLLGYDFSALALAQSGNKEKSACLVILIGHNAGKLYSLDKNETVIGRTDESDINLFDDTVSRQHARITRTEENTYKIVDLGSTNGTKVNSEMVSDKILQEGDKILIGKHTILKFSFQDNIEQRYQQEMYNSAVQDGLTKCYNNRYFKERLKTEMAFAQRHKRLLALIMFDIDLFKQVNDTHGHLAGDYVLSTLANIVNNAVRSEDFLARYGGEEFALIIREVSIQQALILGERIRKLVEEHHFEYEGAKIPVTVSVGVGFMGPESMLTPEEFIKEADDYLYKAKQNGRNRVEYRAL